MNEINKPITMVIKETKIKMINVINESGLPLAVLDLILQGVYSEIHSLVEKQVVEEERVYNEMLKNKDIDNNVSENGDTNESK